MKECLDEFLICIQKEREGRTSKKISLGEFLKNSIKKVLKALLACKYLFV